MGDIEVEKTATSDGFEFQVTVREGRGETRHRVTLKSADYQRLCGSKASPEALVCESFRFLLEREPKEMILRSFDLTVIGRYFPEYEREIMKDRHRWYQGRRREMKLAVITGSTESKPLPDHLRPARIFGVDYVYGHCESTAGVLWVVGQDPDLFDYFLPERWRTTQQIRLFENHETYLTTSKDAVRLVWKVSRVGEYPETAAYRS